MAVKDTSRKAYREMQDSGALGRQALDVLAHVALSSWCMTRSEIAEQTGIRMSSVCGRVNDLVAVGMLEPVGKRQCRVTGRTAEQVQVTCKGLMTVDKSQEVPA